MSGGDLYHSIMAHEDFLEEEVQGILYQTLSALYFLHSKRIVFRDLKADNLMLKHKKGGDEKIEIKLCDFGLAGYMMPGEEGLTGFAGTEVYMAPEVMGHHNYFAQIQEPQPYDYKADVFSLGCLAYELVRGVTPFEDYYPVDGNPINFYKSVMI